MRNANAGSSWVLAAGLAVERQQKFGVDYSGDAFVLVNGAGATELVPIGGDLFAPRYEATFLRIQRVTDASGVWWSVTQPNGTISTIGRTRSARVSDLADTSRVFRWNVERQEDLSGNSMEYHYANIGDGNLYLDSIAYTAFTSASTTIPPSNLVHFSWEPRDDVAPSYATGFRVSPSRRLHSVDVTSNGRRQRLYVLAYTTSAISGVNLLASIRQYGRDAVIAADGSVTGSFLPQHEYRWYSDALSFGAAQVVDRSSGAIDAGYPTGRAWTDFNGDGLGDYCRRVGNTDNIDSFVRCTLATPTGFGADVTSGVVEWGMDTGRSWVDFNADGKSDYCRVFGSSAGKEKVSCLLSTGSGFGADIISGELDASKDAGRAWVDANGDGKADYCRVVAASGTVRCLLSTGAGFGADIASGAIDAGADAGRAWVDVNGDGKADYCRVVGNAVRCLLGGNGGFGQDLSSVAFDVGYDTSRAWVDVNGDGLADYCRLVGNTNLQSSFVRCTLSTGSGFAEEFTSGVVDWGVEPGRMWEDVNGDARADFCRISVNGTARCLLSIGDHFGGEVDTGVINAGDGFGRNWTDRNGDGRADFCRIVDTNVLRCTEIAGARIQPTDGLHEITNGVGGTTSVTYEWSSAYANLLLPFHLATVASLTVSDGRGGSVARHYKYAGGFYVPERRELRGFAQVEEQGPTGPGGEQQVEHIWFHQGDEATPTEPDPRNSVGATSGRVYKAETRAADGTLLHDSAITYLADLQPPHFTPPIAVVEKMYDTSPLAPTGSGNELELDSLFDEFGNRTEKTLKLGKIGATAVDRVVRTAFAVNRQRWILHKPTTSASFAGADLAHPVEQMNFFYDAGDCTTPSQNVTPDRGQLTRYVRWLDGAPSPEVRIGYDAAGNPVCTRDANGHEQHFIYDPSLTVVRGIENALQQVARIEHFGIDDLSGNGLDGEISSLIDANGNREMLRYDAFGRTIAIVNAKGATTRIGYLDEGIATSQRLETTLPTNMILRTYYDGAGRTYRREMTVSGGRVATVDLQFDTRGLLSGKTHPYFAAMDPPQWTRYHRDALGRIERTERPDGATVLRCFRGRDHAIIDEVGHARLEQHDGLGRLNEVDEFRGTFANCSMAFGVPSTSTIYSYDIADHLTLVRDANGALHSFAYDTLGRRVQSTEPDAGTWHFVYDANGNLLRRTDAAKQATLYTYDALNRVLHLEHWKRRHVFDGDVDYIYDRGANGIGRLVWSRSAYSSARFGYDQLGQLVESVQAIGDRTYSYQYAYDPIGRLAQLTYPDGTTVRYDFDGPSLLRIADAATVYAQFADINALGQVGTATLGNGTRSQYTFDRARLWLTSLKAQSPSVGALQSLDYTHYPDGNVHTRADAGVTESFTYDEMDRLITVISPSGAQQFAYDPAGNVTQNPSGTFTYDPARQLLAAVGKQHFAYDPNGNATIAGNRRIEYDSFNRPIVIESGGTRRFPRNRLYLVYDERNLAVRRFVYRGFFHTLLWIPSETMASAGNAYDCRERKCTAYIGNGSTIVAERHGVLGPVYYYHAEPLGSVRAVTDVTGSVVWSARYDAFGSVHATGKKQPKVTFSAKPFEAEVGVFRMGTRLYDPFIGRFYSADFKGQNRRRPQTLNHYSYVHNNPLNYTDPTGAREARMFDEGEDGGGDPDPDPSDPGSTDPGNTDPGNADPGNPGGATTEDPSPGTPEGPISVDPGAPPFEVPPEWNTSTYDPNSANDSPPANDSPTAPEQPGPFHPEPGGSHDSSDHPEPGGGGAGSGGDGESSHYVFDAHSTWSVGGHYPGTSYEYGDEGPSIGQDVGPFSYSVNKYGEISAGVSAPIAPEIPFVKVNVSTVLNPRNQSLVNVTIKLSLDASSEKLDVGVHGDYGVTMSIGQDWWIPFEELDRHIQNLLLSGGMNGN